MMTATRTGWFLGASMLGLASLLGACGDDTTDGASGSTSGGSTSSCGTLEDPDTFTIGDVTPAPGSAVDGGAVVHSFRIVGKPVVLQQIAFVSGEAHTAGAPDPAQLEFSLAQEGADVVYTAAPVAWPSGGHVELSIRDAYDVEGCIYAFPSPLFSYDIDPGGSGGGAGTGGGEGGGGGGGIGGAGEGGAGGG